MAETRQTRRALLTAAASGAAALAANAALGASAVKAAGEPLLMGVGNSPSTPASTLLGTSLAMQTVFSVTNADTTGPNTAISGNSDTGTGLAGYSTSGNGVYGDAMGGGRGVRGGAGSNGTGVYGVSGDDSAAPSDTSVTGVFGYAVEGDHVTTWGSGVWGDSPDFGVYGSGGTGVYGNGEPGGWGVYGWSDTGNGVFGEADTGTALMGISGSGYGLHVSGKIKFATRSGRASVSKGRTSYTKSTGLAGVTAGSIVIAVLQQAETGTWVRAAVAGTGKFTVYFNRALPSSSVVGWMILN